VRLADDEIDLLDVISDLLEFEGFQVNTACDGQAAWDEFNNFSEPIDCILMDLSMPKLSGEDVAQRIRATDKNVPIILMSGYGEREIVNRFKGLNFAAILQKPISLNSLLNLIRTVVTDANEMIK
jgi:two-component system cell cycle sensor histidine kinase/response regulator CckA